MTLNDLIRKASAVAGQLSSGDLELRLIDAITADAYGRKVKDIVMSPYSEDGMMNVGISFETEENEKKVISESRGIIEGFDVVNGSPSLSLRTSVMSYESGSIEDAVIRLPYTGRIDDARDIFFHGPGKVRIIVETEY